MWSRLIEVKSGFRVVHLHNGTVVTVYGPGRHSFWTLNGVHDVVTVDLSADLVALAANDPLPSDLEGTSIIRVEPHERVALFREGLLRQVLGPGRYRWWSAAGEHRLERYDVRAEPTALTDADTLPATNAFFKQTILAEHGLLSRDGRPVRAVSAGRYRIWDGSPWTLAALPKALTAHTDAPDAAPPPGMEVHAVGVHERAVVFWQGNLLHVLTPGRYRWWQVLGPLQIIRYDIREQPAPITDEDPLPSGDRTGSWTEAASVEGTPLVLVRDGQPLLALPEGRYRAWTGGRWSLKPVPRSLQLLDIAPQDLLSADQVPVRIKPAAVVRVEDPVAVLRQPDWPNQVYLAVQLALRELITGRTLEGMLADREAAGAELLERARAHLPALGMALETASIKDIILPGEIKDLLNRVTLARKEAEALAIKRREETAQTRQLANTARLLESNPVLMRLKELEALGEIASKIDRITLVGSGDMVKSVLLSDLSRDRVGAAETGD